MSKAANNKLTTERQPKPYRERRMKFFTCKGTRHTGNAKAQSLKKRYAEMQLCRACRKGVDVNPNQQQLFGMQLAVDPAHPEGEVTVRSITQDGRPIGSITITPNETPTA